MKKRKHGNTAPVVDTSVHTGKRLKWIRSKEYKLADDATLQKILNPPPPPTPEFQPDEYITGVVNDSRLLYKCHEPDCGALFKTSTSLLLHGNKHLNYNLKCTFCGQVFKTEDDLSQHCHDFHPDLQKYPDADPLKCKKCNKVTRDTRALWRHVRETHRNRTYICNYCQFSFLRPENLKSHIKYKHFKEEGLLEQPKFNCNICGKEFGYKNSLATHIRSVHRGKSKRFECKICNSSYSCRGSYNSHMRVKHFNPTFYPCHVCNVKFMIQSKLHRHNISKSHLINTKRAKKNGGVPFVTSIPVIKTVKTVNPNLTNDELKDICKKTVVKIVLHRVDQYVVRPPMIKAESASDDENENTTSTYLNCIYCDKSLPNLNAVKTHESICFIKIRGLKVNICPVCDKTFDKTYDLQKHSRVHMDDRPFKCDYCDAIFKSRAAKCLHEKNLHFGIRAPKIDRVYKCEYPDCENEYKTIKGYRSHRDAIHLGTRYTCEICGKVYRREGIFKKHLKKAHNSCPVRLECKPCNRSYADKFTYRAHLLKARHIRKNKEFEKQLKTEIVIK